MNGNYQNRTFHVAPVREMAKDENKQSCMLVASSDNITNTTNNITDSTQTDRIIFNPQNQFLFPFALKNEQQTSEKTIVEVCLFVC